MTDGPACFLAACLSRKSRISRAISSPSFQGEVTRIEQMEVQRFQVALVRLGPGGREDFVVLAPHDQHRRLVLAEVLLPARIQRWVAAIAEEQVELNFVVTFAIEQELIFGRTVGADEFGVLHSVGVLPLRCIVGEQIANGVAFFLAFRLLSSIP